MNKRVLFLTLSSLCLFSCAAPSSSSQEGAISITDQIGRSISIVPGSYRKIVCIGAGALRLYSYIGDPSLLAGVEDIDNPSLASRPKMFDGTARPYVLANHSFYETLPSCGVGGPNAQTAEAEKILSCGPDLILSEYEDVEKANALSEQTGAPVLTLSYGSSGVFDERFATSLSLLGTILNETAKSDALRAFIEQEKKDLSDRTEAIAEEEKPSVYIAGLGNWGTTNLYMTAQNYEPFNVAHIQNAVTDLSKDGIQKIEKEKLVSLGESIDCMILDAAAIKNMKSTFQDDQAVLTSIKAWNEGNVYLEMAYNAYYTNAEIALANTYYAAKLAYPSAFEDIDMTAKTNEITKAFLGKELASEIFDCPASYGGYQKIDTGTFFQ